MSRRRRQERTQSVSLTSVSLTKVFNRCHKRCVDQCQLLILDEDKYACSDLISLEIFDTTQPCSCCLWNTLKNNIATAMTLYLDSPPSTWNPVKWLSSRGNKKILVPLHFNACYESKEGEKQLDKNTYYFCLLKLALPTSLSHTFDHDLEITSECNA